MALQTEWHKLDLKEAFLLDTVRSREDIEAEALRAKKKVHFGELMELCHEKHSVLPESLRSYKGRVVIRGDQVRDESGFTPCSRNKGLLHHT